MLSLTLLIVLMIVFSSVLFSIVITPLGDETAGLYAFVCLSCMRCLLSFSLPLGFVRCTINLEFPVL